MHPVLGQIKLASFDGEFDIHGTVRQIAYVSADGDDQSVLIIKGLKIEDALHVLDRLRGGLLKDKELAAPVTTTKDESKVVDLSAKAKEKAAASKPATKPQEQMTLPKTIAEALPPKADPEPEPEPDIDDGDDLDADDAPVEDEEPAPINMVMLAKQDKLRGVLEHLIGCGYNTNDKLVAKCKEIKGEIPALKAVDEKGGFDKRIDRAATTMLAGDASA